MAKKRSKQNESRARRRQVNLPFVVAHRSKHQYAVPPEFRPITTKLPGRYPLLQLFRGMERTVPFRKYPGDDAEILRIAKQTSAHVSDGPGWMYVAPTRTPPEVRAGGFKMVETKDDVIVVARDHLANSPPMDVYLDIIHEFLHILQRRRGRNIWPRAKIPYVDRPTEVEAYAFSVAEARRLGVPDSYLREYLEVPWVSKAEALRLLRNVGVSAK
jgi:hypothetical protein